MADVLRDCLNTFGEATAGRTQDGEAAALEVLRSLRARAPDLPEGARSDVLRNQLGRFLEGWGDAASR